jgi:hypothetical protein
MIPWNHVVILVLSCRSGGFSWQGEAFILGPIQQKHSTPTTISTLDLRRTHVADVSFSTQQQKVRQKRLIMQDGCHH